MQFAEEKRQGLVSCFVATAAKVLHIINIQEVSTRHQGMARNKKMELFSLDDFFNMDAATPKTETKKAEKKAGKKPEKKPEKYTLPLKVVSGYSSFTLEGEGEFTLDEIKEKIFASNRMFAPKITKIDIKDGTAKAVFKSMPSSTAGFDKAYTIVLNGFEVPIGPEPEFLNPAGPSDDEDKDGDEKTLIQAAAEAWELQYPDFKGASYLVDDDKCIIVPVMKQNLSDSITVPFTVKVFGGESFEVTAEEVKAVEGKLVATQAREFITKKLGINAGICVTGGGIYAVPDTDKSNASNSNNAKKEEKKIPTATTVVLFNERINVTPNDFGGKEEVTEKEFLKWVCADDGAGHNEFSPERGSWVDYDKKLNLAIPRMPAARKGYGETVTADEAKRLCEESDNCFFI